MDRCNLWKLENSNGLPLLFSCFFLPGYSWHLSVDGNYPYTRQPFFFFFCLDTKGLSPVYGFLMHACGVCWVSTKQKAANAGETIKTFKSCPRGDTLWMCACFVCVCLRDSWGKYGQMCQNYRWLGFQAISQRQCFCPTPLCTIT